MSLSDEEYINLIEVELQRRRLSAREYGRLLKLIKQTSPNLSRQKPKIRDGKNILKQIKDKINDKQ